MPSAYGYHLGMTNNKRFFKNFLIRPKRQLKFAAYNILFGYLLVLFSVLSTQYFNYLTIKNDLSGELIDPIVKEHVFQTLINSMIYPTVLIIFLMLVSFFLIVKISHRFFGPIIPIQDVLNQLLAGKYGEQRTLREGDELAEIMDSVNKLSKSLEARHDKK